MKKLILSVALAASTSLAFAQTSTTTETTKKTDTPVSSSETTTTTTTGGGTITEFSPGSAIVLQESSGPRHYHFGKKVVYVTKSGKELDETTVKTRIKVGVPVHVHYTGEGEMMTVDRVILDED